MEKQLFPVVPPVAKADLRGDAAHPQILGEALFSPFGQGTLVVVRAMGLPPGGFLGLHIHSNGDCSPTEGTAFTAAGAHYDPEGAEHPFHAGDLPPLLSTSEGMALLAVYTDRFRPEEVAGRSILIHGMADDFRSQPAGDSGMRIACGVIRGI